MSKNILITGAAGFIGFHLAKSLLEQNYHVLGIDNFSKSYDIKIKKLRLSKLKKFKDFIFFQKNIKNIDKVLKKKKN